MSSTDSPSEMQVAATGFPETVHPLTLPAQLAGCTADGPGTHGEAPPSDTVTALRRFHLAGIPAADVEADLQPAVWFPLMQATAAADHILLLPGADPDDDTSVGAYPLWPSFLDGMQRSSAATNGASVLRANLPAYREQVLHLLRHADGLAHARTCLAEAGRTLHQSGRIDDKGADVLLHEIDAATSGWSDLARIALPGESATVHLMLQVARDVLHTHRAHIHQQIEERAELLRAALAVDASKDDAARNAQGLQETFGSLGASFLDTQELARSLGPWRGAPALPLEQRLRAEEILDSLQQALDQSDAPVLVLVHDGFFDTRTLQQEVDCEIVTHDDPCSGAAALFEVRARETASLFRDMHVAQLILENRYEPARHDPWFERFDWEGFTDLEFFHLPTVVAVEPAERLSARHLPSLSELLLSGKPVQVLAWQAPGQDPSGPDEELMSHSRMELAYLGIGHRKALVQQATLHDAELTARGYRRALESPHPALHVLSQVHADDAALFAVLQEAATQSRAHPLFCYNPDAGNTWAARMDFAGNPEAHQDWPTCELAVTDHNDATREWQLPCTFADFVLLEKSLLHHFMRIPDDCRSADFMRLDAMLQLPQDEVSHLLPWIWAVDATGVLHRLLVSRRLVRACRDRLDTWHTLQELAGIRNQYVEEAVLTTREQERQTHAAAVQRLSTEHQAELQSVERQAVKRSMRRLARMLLDLDPLSTAAAVSAAQTPIPTPQTAADDAARTTTDDPTPSPDTTTAQVATAPSPADDETAIEDPWIDSILCTSCNDCLQINARMFVYNDNKQAMIGDAQSGTFEQLVRAAEKCPAHCIHPGKPLDPQEPNLESLLQRAAPFN